MCINIYMYIHIYIYMYVCVYPITPPYLSPRAMVLFLYDFPMLSGYNMEKYISKFTRKTPGITLQN